MTTTETTTTTTETGTTGRQSTMNGQAYEWDTEVEQVKRVIETGIVLARSTLTISREQSLVVTKLQEALHWLVYTHTVGTTKTTPQVLG